MSSVLSSAATNAYLRGDLGYESDQPYKSPDRPDLELPFVQQPLRVLDGRPPRRGHESRIRTCASFSSSGKRRDLAVPLDSTLFSVSHLPIPASLRPNITFQYYDAGHMMYLNKPDAEKLRRDLLGFIVPGK